MTNLKKELMELSNSVVSVEEDRIVLTYDCGNIEDAENFVSKVKRKFENDFSNNFNIAIYVLEDESGEDEEWTIVNIDIKYSSTDSIEDIKKFISFIDSI